MAGNFIKKRLQHRYFLVNIVKLLRTAFFIEHLSWLLLYFFNTFSSCFCRLFHQSETTAPWCCVVLRKNSFSKKSNYPLAMSIFCFHRAVLLKGELSLLISWPAILWSISQWPLLKLKDISHKDVYVRCTVSVKTLLLRKAIHL